MKIKTPKASVFRLNIKTESHSDETFYEDMPTLLRKIADDIEFNKTTTKKFGSIEAVSRLKNRWQVMGYWGIRNRFKDDN